MHDVDIKKKASVKIESTGDVRRSVPHHGRISRGRDGMHHIML
jgi:hypothetical protein